MALPAALLIQLQLSEHTAGLVSWVYQQSQNLHTRQAENHKIKDRAHVEGNKKTKNKNENNFKSVFTQNTEKEFK